MSKRLWEKGEEINRQIHDFTVGDDPVVDLELLEWDALGSAAQAKMLLSIGIINKEECVALLTRLHEIFSLAKLGQFEIPNELEDCHTAIESFLTKKLGDAGRKIHTGRSRNDQVMLAMRLYLRAKCLLIQTQLIELAESFLKRAEDSIHQQMPGYTHLQLAMPSSVGMWLHAFAEATIFLIQEGRAILNLLDSNPLGVASGFHVPLPLDRELSSKLLGFSRAQRSAIDTQNSRGRHELKLLRWSSDIATSIEKFAWDLILYSTKEFGFFSLPTSFTTGSSIMPQKHNPDVLELLRARAAKVRGAENELNWVIAKLPSNYHRDFQYSKEPVIRGLGNIIQIIPIVNEIIPSFTLNTERINSSLTPELYATYDVYREVRAGKTFRDAYQETASRINHNKLDLSNLSSDFDIIANICSTEIKQAKIELQELKSTTNATLEKITQIEKNAFAL